MAKQQNALLQSGMFVFVDSTPLALCCPADVFALDGHVIKTSGLGSSGQEWLGYWAVSHCFASWFAHASSGSHPTTEVHTATCRRRLQICCDTLWLIAGFWERIVRFDCTNSWSVPIYYLPIIPCNANQLPSTCLSQSPGIMACQLIDYRSVYTVSCGDHSRTLNENLEHGGGQVDRLTEVYQRCHRPVDLSNLLCYHPWYVISYSWQICSNRLLLLSFITTYR